ncbi:MAG: hypothetical protein ACE5IR_27800 [bacterium]
MISILFLLFPAVVYALDIAIIVHLDNKTDSVTARELSRIFKQEKQRWDENKKVYLVMQESGSIEKEIFVKKVFRMRPNELKRYWLTKILKGEISAFPKTLSSNKAIKRFVNQIPTAIGFIDATLVDASVKVLSIDGKRPGDEGYFLSGK